MGERMNAVDEVTEAIATYGRPLWVAHIPKPIRDAVPVETLRELVSNAKWSTEGAAKREGWGDLMVYCRENVYESVTVNDLTEACGLSIPTIRKFISDRPDIFRKIQRGLWEIRDPESDRKLSK
jgi:hypothetical protein